VIPRRTSKAPVGSLFASFSSDGHLESKKRGGKIMFRRYVFGFAAVVALAAASLLLLPETSYAQRRGGVGVGRGGGWGGGWGGYRGG